MHENVKRNSTGDLTSSGGPHLCFIVFQELNILPDKFLSNQLCTNRLGKLREMAYQYSSRDSDCNTPR